MRNRAILLFGHETWPAAMKASAEMISGPKRELYSIFVHVDDSAQQIEETCKEEITSLRKKGYEDILILMDLFGGSPSHIVAQYYQDLHIRAICGVNMPMLLEILSLPDTMPLDEVCQKAIECGISSIIDEFTKLKESVRG